MDESGYDHEYNYDKETPLSSQAPSNDMEYILNQLSSKYVNLIKNERQNADQKQLKEIHGMLNDWMNNVSHSFRETVETLKQADSLQRNEIDVVMDDVRDRQVSMINTIKDAHAKQIDILRAAISEERKQAAQTQLIFEQTLKTRYESMVDALHEKVKAEQDARMQRALDNLERSARMESERAKQSYEIHQEAELALSRKFKGIVNDLRKSWEEEETGRAMQLEERLRSHYSVVLEHMESQLKMALQLQDDADKQWLEDVEARNKQQIETLKAFEAKCRRLYDARLSEYAEKTSEQMSQYEDQLLEMGSTMATEKAQFESRLRRMKLACNRWKIAYQSDIHQRYQNMTNLMEEKYIDEISKLLDEINTLKSSLSEANKTIALKEKSLMKSQELMSNNGWDGVQASTGSAISSSTIREDIEKRWNELKTPVAERIETLVQLLDSSKATPEMLSIYEMLQTKLGDRVPIVQALNRKQFIEYKLKLAARFSQETHTQSGSGASSSGATLSAADRTALITELTDLQSSTEQMIKHYEKKHGENLFRNPVATAVSSSNSYPISSPSNNPTMFNVSSPPSTFLESNASPSLSNPSNSSTLPNNPVAGVQPIGGSPMVQSMNSPTPSIQTPKVESSKSIKGGSESIKKSNSTTIQPSESKNTIHPAVSQLSSNESTPAPANLASTSSVLKNIAAFSKNSNKPPPVVNLR